MALSLSWIISHSAWGACCHNNRMSPARLKDCSAKAHYCLSVLLAEKRQHYFPMLVTGLNCGSAVKTTSIILHTQHPVSTKGQIAWEDLSDFWFSVASLQFSDSATYKIIKAACFATASRCSNKTCCIKAINRSWAGTLPCLRLFLMVTCSDILLSLRNFSLPHIIMKEEKYTQKLIWIPKFMQKPLGCPWLAVLESTQVHKSQVETFAHFEAGQG